MALAYASFSFPLTKALLTAWVAWCVTIVLDAAFPSFCIANSLSSSAILPVYTNYNNSLSWGILLGVQIYVLIGIGWPEVYRQEGGRDEKPIIASLGIKTRAELKAKALTLAITSRFRSLAKTTLGFDKSSSLIRYPDFIQALWILLNVIAISRAV